MNWTTFNTDLGPCGIAWTRYGVGCLNLPEYSMLSVKNKMRKRTGISKPTTKPPLWVVLLIQKIQAHFRGNIQNFSRVPLDLNESTEFYRKVFKATRKINPGTVKSYGEIAKEINSPKAARAVGMALSKNPIGLIVPCHRVILSSSSSHKNIGRNIGGFSAYGGATTKKKILQKEGVCL